MIDVDKENPLRILYAFNSLSDIYVEKRTIPFDPFSQSDVDILIKDRVPRNTFIDKTIGVYENLMTIDFFRDNVWIHTQDSQFYIDELGSEFSLLSCCKKLKAGINLDYSNKTNIYQALYTCSERKFLNDKFLQSNAEYCIYTTLPTCRLCFCAVKHIMNTKSIKFLSSDLEHGGIESFTYKSNTVIHKDRNKALNENLKKDLK